MPWDTNALTDFLNERTRFGQYPVVAYKVESSVLTVWTHPSNRLDQAHEVLSSYPGEHFPRLLSTEAFDDLDDADDLRRVLFRFDLGSAFDASSEEEIHALNTCLHPFGRPLTSPSMTDNGGRTGAYVEKDVVLEFIRWLQTATKDGLFPIVSYSIEGRRIAVLTTNIKDLGYATRVLEVVTERGYNLGHFIPRVQVMKLAAENQHVFHHVENEFSGLNRTSAKGVTRIVQSFGAPYFPHRAIGLVDIVGYSKLSPPEQLAYLYSLKRTLRSTIARCTRFCEALGVRKAFGFESTGDGYYIWHEDLGPAADTATFSLLVTIMAHTESFRSTGAFDLQLRASYAIGGLYQMYDHTRLLRAVKNAPPAGVDLNSSSFWPRAAIVTGPATILAERVISEGRGSQILVADFSRPGTDETEMTTGSLVDSVNDLFPVEGNGPATLSFDPDHQLKLLDKHGMPYYCWNVCGDVPNKLSVSAEATMQSIGIRRDTTPLVSSIDFVELPSRGDGVCSTKPLYKPELRTDSSRTTPDRENSNVLMESDDDSDEDTFFSSVRKFLGGS